ncbi:Zinc finger BED domain-containing protein DAYSLEEPER [Rhizoctonia solani]|uniref:Zinc finger BED domain-containing protein DAYSLEEPER n=1 Tax=Rhizoctonia solani TaxID=456999 RepID=A0A0K6GCF2_9AGAM|nr:Zinc finger BED domain-containing protein DAYSLEEPER [Rhizoctonia solani]
MTDSKTSLSLKRLRLDDSDDSSDDELATYPPPNVSPWRRNPSYAHREHLVQRATKNNVADTPHFAKHTALVYQFLDMAEAIEDNAHVLLSCTFHCGICGRGEWHWVKGGKSRGSTTNMNRHMKDWHNTVWTAAKHADGLARTRINDQPPLVKAEGSVLTSSEVGETYVDIFYKKLTRWIVMRNHAFTEIENDEFRDLISFLQPALSDHFVQANALRNRIFGHAGTQREWLKSYLSSIPGLLAIACDAWTSSNRIAFLAITASWITKEWKREETLIDFRELHGAHTGRNMAEEVTAVVSELGIEDRVLALVSNNASNNGTLVKSLDDTLGRLSSHLRWDSSKGHIRCLPHVIHLAVMALLLGINAIPPNTNIRTHIDDDSSFTEEDAENVVAGDDREVHENGAAIDPTVNLKSACDKIRKISRLVRSSPQRMELFKTLATRIEEDKEQKGKFSKRPYIKKRIKNLVLDVVLRWNSLYFMLERALEFREAIDALCSHSLGKVYEPYRLSDSDWEMVSFICGWLKFFRGATQKMSGEKYPTLSFSLRVYSLLINYVSTLADAPSVQSVPSLMNGLEACQAKLLEFFDKSTFDSEYYYFATVLDPRFKDSLFRNEPDLFSPEWAEDCAKALEETCELYYTSDKYIQAPEHSDCNHKITDPNDFESAWQVGIPTEYPQDDTTISIAEELAFYLADPITHMNPLDWWRENCNRFPRLAAMARDFLSIPGSSVGVERVLSAGRDVISLRQSSLAADTIRVLMTYRAALQLEKNVLHA